MSIYLLLRTVNRSTYKKRLTVLENLVQSLHRDTIIKKNEFTVSIAGCKIFKKKTLLNNAIAYNLSRHSNPSPKHSVKSKQHLKLAWHSGDMSLNKQYVRKYLFVITTFKIAKKLNKNKTMLHALHFSALSARLAFYSLVPVKCGYKVSQRRTVFGIAQLSGYHRYQPLFDDELTKA